MYSLIPNTGKLRFIEVKGRMADADSITVIHNEALIALNRPEAFILAIVAFQDEGGHEVRYLREPFGREAGFRGGERELQAGRALGAGREAGLNRLCAVEFPTWPPN